MRRTARRVVGAAGLVAVGTWGAVAGCNSIDGLTDVPPIALGDGGPVPVDSSGTDVSTGDATISPESGSPETGTTGDGGADAAPGPCSQATNGTTCDAGAVCNMGSCVPCAAGSDCSDAGSCAKSSIVCSSGDAVCTSAGTAIDGTPCGPDGGMLCQAGVCEACSPGASCQPAAPNNPCDLGAAQCTAGVLTGCTDDQMPAPAGISCGTNMVCDGGAGCGPCTAGTSCDLPGNTNPCMIGTSDCATGTQQCKATQAANGAACGNKGTCNSTGLCVCPAGTTLQTDPANCGACGHDCVGGLCSGGACEAWPIGSPAVTAATNPELRCDGTYAVYSDGSGIIEYPAILTVSQVSATPAPAYEPPAPPLFALGPGKLSWFAPPGGSPTYNVNEVAEGTATTASPLLNFAAATMVPAAIGIDPSGTNAIVLGEYNSTGVAALQVCPLAGSCAFNPVLTSDALGSNGTTGLQNLLVASSTQVFWTTPAPAIVGFNLTTMTTTTFGTSANTFAVFAADPPGTASPLLYFYQGGLIESIPQSFTSTTVATGQINAPNVTSLTSDGTKLYFASAGAISSVVIGGTSAPVPVYTGSSSATILGLTTAMVPGEFEEAVYWLSQVKSGTQYSYTVMGLVLPPP